MSNASWTCLAALLLSIAQTELHARDDYGYRRQYKAAEKEMKPETLSGDALLKLLDDSWFYNREVAGDELRRRGIKHLPLILHAITAGSAESQRRAEAILIGIKGNARLAIVKERKPTFKLAVENPRFWEGTNSYIGGHYDRSLDSNIIFQSSMLIELIQTPFPIKEAVTDQGEKVDAQVWAHSRSTSTSYSLFLNRPKQEFKQVNVTLRICGFTPCNEEYAGAFETITHVVHENICTLTVSRGKEGFVIEALDVLGRLEKSELSLLTMEEKAYPVRLIPKPGAYRFVWSLPLNEKEALPERFEFKISGTTIHVECEEKVIVPCPK